jgi:hypothetical protein
VKRFGAGKLSLGICVIIAVLVVLLGRVLRFAAGLSKVVVLLVALLGLLAFLGLMNRK